MFTNGRRQRMRDAKARLAKFEAQLAAERELAQIVAERHALTVADTEQRHDLVQTIMSSEDSQLQREATRQLRAFEARRVQREELLAASATIIRVVETTRIENGQANVSHGTQREINANADSGAQIVMEQINTVKAANRPAVATPDQPSDDTREILLEPSESCSKDAERELNTIDATSVRRMEIQYVSYGTITVFDTGEMENGQTPILSTYLHHERIANTDRQSN
ncbi:hypothetical protein BJ741DRAFT_618559 [Chytriomyces cf. hyalinus JEL632]|nr:hypothetical protein BJ741DRAFT_618559 [Chytriomyces cf. hyalinus JEL632]